MNNSGELPEPHRYSNCTTLLALCQYE